MRKKCHKGPDAEGLGSADMQAAFPMPSSEAAMDGSKLLTSLSCAAEGRSWAARLWDPQQPRWRAKGCRENTNTKVASEVPSPCPWDSGTYERGRFTALKSLLATSVAACVWITCLLRGLGVVMLFLSFYVVQVMCITPQGSSFEWFWSNSRPMNSALCRAKWC